MSLLGGDDIDAVRPDSHPVPDLENLHAGGALQQFGHDPLVGRVQVLDDDKCHAAFFRHMPQELPQRLQPAGGGADADDGKVGAVTPWRRFSRGRLGRRIAGNRRFKSLFHMVIFISNFSNWQK
jgi:hypothetical protein